MTWPPAQSSLGVWPSNDSRANAICVGFSLLGLANWPRCAGDETHAGALLRENTVLQRDLGHHEVHGVLEQLADIDSAQHERSGGALFGAAAALREAHGARPGAAWIGAARARREASLGLRPRQPVARSV